MRADREHPAQPLPADLESARQAINGTDPAHAALACHVAFHGPQIGDLRNLQLTEIRDGRIFLPGAAVVLADAVRERLAVWLDEQARRWPDRVNPHLLMAEAMGNGGDVRRLRGLVDLTVAGAEG